MDNLADLTELVKKTNADLGVAMMVMEIGVYFVDEGGTHTSGVIKPALYWPTFDQKQKLKTSVVCPINSSYLYPEYAIVLITKFFLQKWEVWKLLIA